MSDYLSYLTAHAAGLSTVMGGFFDEDKTGKIINIPEEHEVMALTPTGYSDQPTLPA